MLEISDATMGAFQTEGLRALRPRILAHWHEELRGSGDIAGPAKRDRVLNEIDEIAREDPSLSEADLTMLADLMLVDVANQARTARR